MNTFVRFFWRERARANAFAKKYFELDEDLGIDLTSEKAAARVAKRLAKHQKNISGTLARRKIPAPFGAFCLCCGTQRGILIEPFAVSLICGGAYLRDCWGVVQPVGHRTVNADGEGSNPSAPAKISAGSARQGLVVGKPAAFQPRQPPSIDSTFA